MKKIYRKVLLFAIILLIAMLECACSNPFSSSSTSNPTKADKVTFKIIFSSYLSQVHSGSTPNSIVKLSNGNYIVVTTVYYHHSWDIIKLDKKGNVLNMVTTTANIKSPFLIFKTRDDNLLLIYSSLDPSSLDYEIGVIKFTHNLEKIWSKKYSKYNGFSAATKTKNGNYVIAANTKNGYSSLLKMDSSGNIFWKEPLNVGVKGELVKSNYKFRVSSIAEDAKGNLILAGKREDSVFLIIKLNKEGEIVWATKLSVPYKHKEGFELKLYNINSVITLPNSNKYIVCGRIANKGLPVLSLGWITKISENGNVEWSIITGKGENFSAVADHTGDLIVVGNRDICKDKVDGTPVWCTSYLKILRIDLAGNLKWEKVFREEGTFYSVNRDTGNSYIAIGYVKSKEGCYPLIVKFSM